MKFFVCGLGLTLIAIGYSSANAQECQARIVLPVWDDLGNAWKAGSTLPVNIERIGTQGSSFCASGGSCLPSRVGGSAALALLNCTVGPAIGGGDYRLIPSVQKAGAAAASALQMRQNATEKLSALGFSNASAGSLAEDYVRAPHSRNARLVAQALAGSRAAVAVLKHDHP